MQLISPQEWQRLPEQAQEEGDDHDLSMKGEHLTSDHLSTMYQELIERVGIVFYSKKQRAEKEI